MDVFTRKQLQTSWVKNDLENFNQTIALWPDTDEVFKKTAL